MMASARSESGTHRRSNATAGSTVISTSNCPPSMPTLKASSDTSRFEPANWSCDCSMAEKPKPCTSPNRPLVAQRRCSCGRSTFSIAMKRIETRDQHFDQRREPCARRRQAVGRGDQGDRVADGERRDDADQVAVEAPERKDQADAGTAGGPARAGRARIRTPRRSHAAWYQRGSRTTGPWPVLSS